MFKVRVFFRGDRQPVGRRVIPLAPLVILTGCTSVPDGEERFHVNSAGMSMPVVVFGDRDASTLIVHLHGGPGESRIDTWLGAETRLAERFLFATWAQRSTAFATGNLRRDTMTLEQHVLDLRAVLEVLHAKYPAKRIVLTAFSWGGAMAIDYLTTQPADYVEGLVVVGGLISARVAIDSSWPMLAEHGAHQIARGGDRDYWEEVVDLSGRFTNALETLASEDYLDEFVRPRVDACSQMRRDLDLPDNVENEPKSTYERYQLLPPAEAKAVRWVVEELLAIDLQDRLPAIEVPALVLWGELDCNIPIDSFQIALDEIPNARGRAFPGIPHDVIDSAPADYAHAVGEFIDELP
ncbi:MAG: alpha/beta hydrolase [Myxococcota bacterium]